MYKRINLGKRILLNQRGLDLLEAFLEYDPERRITAEKAFEHPYFREDRRAATDRNSQEKYITE